jgi:hypothetical protein
MPKHDSRRRRNSMPMAALVMAASATASPQAPAESVADFAGRIDPAHPVQSILNVLESEISRPFAPFVKEPSVNNAIDGVTSIARFGVSAGSHVLDLDPVTTGSLAGLCVIGGNIDRSIGGNTAFFSLDNAKQTVTDGFHCATFPSSLAVEYGAIAVRLVGETAKLAWKNLSDPRNIVTVPQDAGNLLLNTARQAGDATGSSFRELPPFLTDPVYGAGNMAGDIWKKATAGAEDTPRKTAGYMRMRPVTAFAFNR